MKVTRSWIVGELGVNALQKACLDNGWVLQTVPGQTDFGKDGYLDLTEDGELTGACVAVQVKGGHSRTSEKWIRIDADPAHRKLWMASSVPVIGITWDDKTKDLLWVDITSTLRTEGIKAAIHAPRENDLRAAPQEFADHVRRAAISPPWGLGSDDPNEQASAVLDCWALSNTDIRPLRIVRRVMFELDDEALAFAVKLFSRFTFHPDRWLTEELIAEDRERGAIVKHLKWSAADLVRLFAMVARLDLENGLGRGSIRQDVALLALFQWDPLSIIEEAATLADKSGELDAAHLLLLLRLDRCEDGSSTRETFKYANEELPNLFRDRPTRMQDLESQIATYGEIYIY